MTEQRRPADQPLTPNETDDLGSARPTRRTVLGWTALAGGSASLSGLASARPRGEVRPTSQGFDVVEASIAQLQSEMEAGNLTSRELVKAYLTRIRQLDAKGPGVNSVIEINPDAGSIAHELDRERRRQGARGPLHGIPILLKDNIDTADGMITAAGSLALVGTPPAEDATVAARLRDAGAVILGKANLSEWANFRGFSSSSGWCGRGGQTNNPYVLDRNPCGSSAGSAASTAASFCAAALGTETDGSIVCPSSANNVVGIKPTVGLTSRAGVVPISFTQDTVGPHGRTVADAATVLGALTGVDPRDPATDASDGNFFSDYTQFLDPNGLDGARIGVVRQLSGFSEETDAIFETALQTMQAAGAVLVDPADIPSFDEFAADPSELIVLIFEFKRDLNAYLATRAGVPVSSLAEVIQFNLDHADEELLFFGQQLMELAEADTFSEAEYLEALETGFRLAATEGIDATLDGLSLDALVAPTNSPPWPTDLVNGDCFLGGSSSFAAVARYPLVTVPAGFAFGLPVGITFMGTAWSEPSLIRLASGFEAAAAARRPPEFLSTLDLAAPDRVLPASRQLRESERHDGLRRLLQRSRARWRMPHSL